MTAQIGQLQWGTELPESRTDSEKETSNGVISKEFWPFFWYGSKAEDDINPKWKFFGHLNVFHDLTKWEIISYNFQNSRFHDKVQSRQCYTQNTVHYIQILIGYFIHEKYGSIENCDYEKQY